MQLSTLAPAGAAFDPFNQSGKGPAPPLERKAEDRSVLLPNRSAQVSIHKIDGSSFYST